MSTVTAQCSLALIDDHEVVREGLRALLAETGRTPVVYCGDQPHEAALSGAQVALLDVDLGPSGLPVSDSVQLLTEAGTHVLLLSAYEDSVAIRSALNCGALGFVAKRVSLDSLVEAIDVVASGELYLSMDLASILSLAPETPDLSPRELHALRLYASGLKLSAVAANMGISPHTAKEYLDRVRTKYGHVGRTARTRTQMFAEAQRDGLLDT